jgi:uncharacterized protein (TIGR02598 family)
MSAWRMMIILVKMHANHHMATIPKCYKRGCTGASPLSNGGFSLVEVVLSLGVLVFCLVALLGLMPMGIQSFRSAMSMTVEAQIAQSLSSDLQLTDFSNLEEATYYFDDQGLWLNGATAAEESRIRYTATVTLRTLESPANLPATAAKNALIGIVNKTTPDRRRDYSVVVVNNNR